MKKFIVGILGKEGAGKDTAAMALESIGFARTSFAAAAYEDVANMFGVSVEELKSREWKTTPQTILCGDCCDSQSYRKYMQQTGWDLRTPRTSREHMQKYAGDMVRSRNEMAWIRRSAPPPQDLSDRSWVWSDVRYSKEAEWLRATSNEVGHEFILLQIERTDNPHPQTTHTTNSPLSCGIPPLVVHNIEGDMEGFIKAVVSTIKGRYL